ncbi:MAG TPA: SBBP repeat-containing protein, partial [Candidatus Bathyarchaeia archaeon]|nr:SBBP repeat-containing protein [Candidatus Bathyarchaeia archaeon]
MRKNLRLVMTSFNLVLLLMLLLLSVPKRDQSSNNCVISNAVAVIVSYPVLNFSTYLGGSESGEHGCGIAIASDRSYYVMGHTDSSDFPTQNAYDNTSNGSRDVFIAKFAANNSLLWSTYFGGSLQDWSMDIANAADGSCYITGTTLSDNFPTLNAYNDTYSGDNRGDVFLVKFAANGSLLWSTYFGGKDWDFGHGIAVATDGSCYITGETGSTNFPVQGAYDNTYNGWYFDAFVAKFSNNGSLLWSTYLGGFDNDGGYDIAITSDGSCFVTGLTYSSDFPTTKDA